MSDGSVAVGAAFEFRIAQKLLYAIDDIVRMCEIVDRRTIQLKKRVQHEYYVHFPDLDRRCDCWVSPDKLRVATAAEMAEFHHTSGGGGGDTPGGTPGSGASSSAAASPGGNRRLTRREKRKFDELNHGDGAGGHGGHGSSGAVVDPTTAMLEHEHSERTKVKNITQIQLGDYLLDTWYYSPYPDAFAARDVLYVCEFCLKYMKKFNTLQRHMEECEYRHPPGNEIYRHNGVSVFEVDGSKFKVYCQCLCLLSKLFLDHKTLYYDVDPFLFYITCEYDKNGYHIVGYFSKEKHSAEDYNVACILTFPQYQRKGYGRFLITLSYELSKIEGKLGSPEKPLSDLGRVSYKAYWTNVLLELFAVHSRRTLGIKEVSTLTSIKAEDIIYTLQSLGLSRYWKGQHIISATPKLVQQHLAALKPTSSASSNRVRFDASKLVWRPPKFK